MKYFINFANGGFFNSQNFGIQSAKKFGFECLALSASDIDTNFLESNSRIFSLSRGFGYWLWKPHLILKILSQINNNDYLIYMDSGAALISDPSEYLDLIDDNGILSFSMVQRTSKWTKGDCFFEINNNKDYSYADKNQLQATYIFFRKCDNSVTFVKEWLNFCTKENLITDSENLYLNNLPDFIEHRHDQSIFSLLCYNRNILNVPQIDQYCVEHGLDISRKIINRHGIRS